MERIQIKDFGPIKDIEIIIKDINMFIGRISSGKSTVAKIISIFKDRALRNSPNHDRFIQLLGDCNIYFEINYRTSIRYEQDEFYFEVNAQSVSTNFIGQDHRYAYNSIYIPSERIAFSTISQYISRLISNNISIPNRIGAFEAKFEEARSTLKKYPIDFLDIVYEYDGTNDYIMFSNGQRVKLSQVSGGLQSIVPLILVVYFGTKRNDETRNMFVIEEPEMNIYPSTQKALIEYVLGRVNQSQDQIVITTHSPYIITALDNLIQARSAVDSNSAIEEAVNDLVPSRYWININGVSCYYFDNGGCKSTMDDEIGSIGPSHIDEVSTEISNTFERLLALKYPS
jgi:AAA15 family ATPase/GTPase